MLIIIITASLIQETGPKCQAKYDKRFVTEMVVLDKEAMNDKTKHETFTSSDELV